MDLLVGGIACAVLGYLAWSMPGLRFVDFVFFSERAEGLRGGHQWVHPLYPVGYPLLLSGLQALTGDVLLAGKLLSVGAGVGVSVAISRYLSPWAALAGLAQMQVLIWGASEGTDLIAAALALGALAAVQKRPGLAGVLAGLACMMRYTGVAVVPVVLWMGGWRCLLGIALATAPHWVGALVLGMPLLPDQSANLSIAEGPPGSGPAQGGFFSGLWVGAKQASFHLRSAWPSLLGALGLAVGMARRDRRAWALAAYASLHFAGLSLAFANPRLALPTLLAMSLGLYWLIPRRWLLLLVPAVLAWSWPMASQAGPDADFVVPMVQAAQTLEGRFASSTPWFYTKERGWLRAPVIIWEAGEAGRLDPQTLHAWCLKDGVDYLVLDRGRVRRAPKLQRLAVGASEPGFERVVQDKGWVIWRVLP